MLGSVPLRVWNTQGRSLSGPDTAKGSLFLVVLAMILTVMTGLKDNLGGRLYSLLVLHTQYQHK